VLEVAVFNAYATVFIKFSKSHGGPVTEISPFPTSLMWSVWRKLSGVGLWCVSMCDFKD